MSTARTSLGLAACGGGGSGSEATPEVVEGGGNECTAGNTLTDGILTIVESVPEIVAALEAAYATDLDGMQADNIAFASGYDADLIYDQHWRPTIELLAKRTLPAIPASRAERRAAKRKSK